MKFDINKEFSLSQIFDFFKQKAKDAKNLVSKIDRGSIKTITVSGRSIRLNAVRLGLIAAVFAIALALLINLAVLPGTKYRQYWGIEFDTVGDYQQHACGSDILLFNHSGMKLINNRGQYKWEVPLTLTNPSVDIDGKYILLSDLEGNCSLNLYNLKGKNIVSYPINTELLSAKINKKGTVAAAVSEEGYKGSVVVYNRKGEEIFKWNSGEGYITDLDISNDGKSIAVAQMMSDGDETYSKIHIISISSGKETGSYVCEKSLTASVTFDERNRIIAAAQNKIYGLSKNGDERFVIDLAGKSAEKYNITDGNSITILCRGNRGGSVLEIYNKSGKLTGVYSTDDQIKKMSLCGDTIAVSTSRSVMRVSSNGKLRKRKEIDHDIMSIGVYGNGRNVLVLGGNSADITRMK